jgi:hypothetical protein
MSIDQEAEVVRLVPITDDARRHDALRQLAAEWWDPPAELIDTLPKGGIELRYLSHAWVRKALQDHDPDWWWEPMGYDDQGQPVIERDSQGQPVGLWIWLHVLGTKRPGYGSVEPGKRDAVKELIGDALRNAAQPFCGGALWVKTKPGKPEKRSAGRRAPTKGKTYDPVAKAEETAENASEDSPHYEKEYGKEQYDRLLEQFGKEATDGALAMLNISQFHEMTPAKVKVLEGMLLARERQVKENAEREAQLKRERGEA